MKSTSKLSARMSPARNFEINQIMFEMEAFLTVS